MEGFDGLSAMNGDFIEKEPTENKVLVIGDIELNDNEKRVLAMNPKYRVYTEIDLEEVVKETAVGGVKTRWHKKSNPELYEDPARLEVELGVQANALTWTPTAVVFAYGEFKMGSFSAAAQNQTVHEGSAAEVLASVVNLNHERS